MMPSSDAELQKGEDSPEAHETAARPEAAPQKAVPTDGSGELDAHEAPMRLKEEHQSLDAPPEGHGASENGVLSHDEEAEAGEALLHDDEAEDRVEAPAPNTWTAPNPSPAEDDQTRGEVASAGESQPDEGSAMAMAPLRAMRVIKLSQTAPRPPQPASPKLETREAPIGDVEEIIQEEELGDLEPTPAPPAATELNFSPHAESAQSSEAAAAPETGAGLDMAALELPQEAAAARSDPIPLQHTDPTDLDSIEDISPEPSSMNPEAAEPFDVPPAERKPPPPRRSAKPSLPQAQKPRKKPWWETLFGDDFSRAYRAMTPSQLSREVDFIIEALELPPGAILLDLGCGQGEICVELARRGYSVVGYDLSVYQLAMAGDLAQRAKQKINFLQGDMREMAFDGMFDGVISWDTSFGYFEEDKNVEVLRRVFQALKPNGRFLLDILNRDFVAAQAPYSHWFEGDGCVCMDDMNMDFITNRMKVKRSIILDDGRSKELHYSVRLYGLSDIGRLLHEVGFRVSNVSGDVSTKGAFFGPCSRRIVIQAARP